jgi:DNA-binding LacI/PurR family transcriptional regulator
MSARRQTVRRSQRVRQADVARAAGVSQAAVSVALAEAAAGTTQVSNGTRARIVEVASGLGYAVNPVARNLVGGRTGLLGVHTFERVFPINARDFFQEFLVGIECAAETAGYDLLLSTRATAEGGRRSVYSGGFNRLGLADGSILLGRDEDPGEIQRLVDEGYPFVFIGRRDSFGSGVSCVTGDYRPISLQVLNALLALGHRRIAYVGRTDPLLPDLDRQAAWDEVCSGLEAAHFSRPVGGLTPELARRLIAEGFTAVVLEEAETGETHMDVCRAAGIDIPGELSVVVLGNNPGTAIGDLVPSGFRIPRQEMGEAAVRLLLERLADPDLVRMAVVPCAFEVGQTMDVPRKARRS